MKCPTCPEATLLMSERQGVEIDYCPTCRGVWLDRGELDKLIQLSAQSQAVAAPAPAAPRRDDDDYRKPYRGDYRKKSWLSDIFD